MSNKALRLPGPYLDSVIETRVGRWVLGGHVKRQTNQVLDLLKHLDDAAPQASPGPLGGRRPPIFCTVDGLGSLVLKPYVRGGLAARIFKDRYFRKGPPRSAIEYSVLCLARELEIQAPDPIGYLATRERLYRCWLITREIPGARTLADISLSDSEHAISLTQKVVMEIGKLVRHRLVHADLHPGNVLISDTGDVFLIDFDKAALAPDMTRETLIRRYCRRWDRAVRKHRLPAFLTGQLSSLTNLP